jgi:hypothetical protein
MPAGSINKYSATVMSARSAGMLHDRAAARRDAIRSGHQGDVEAKHSPLKQSGTAGRCRIHQRHGPARRLTLINTR